LFACSFDGIVHDLAATLSADSFSRQRLLGVKISQNTGASKLSQRKTDEHRYFTDRLTFTDGMPPALLE